MTAVPAVQSLGGDLTLLSCMKSLSFNMDICKTKSLDTGFAAFPLFELKYNAKLSLNKNKGSP